MPLKSKANVCFVSSPPCCTWISFASEELTDLNSEKPSISSITKTGNCEWSGINNS